MIAWKRLIRTLSSERFIGSRSGEDVAAVDLHYLGNGTVAGTVFLFKSAGFRESEVEQLLQSLDETMLPDADLAAGSLTFTVVHGDVWGSFEACEGSITPHP